MKKIAVLVLTVGLGFVAAQAQSPGDRIITSEAMKGVAAAQRAVSHQNAFQAVLAAHDALIKGGLTEGEGFTEDHAIQQVYVDGLNLQEAIVNLAKQDMKQAQAAAKIVDHAYYVATFKKSMTLDEINREAHIRFPNSREKLNIQEALKKATKKK